MTRDLIFRLLAATVITVNLDGTANASGGILGPIGPHTPGFGIGTGGDPGRLPDFDGGSGGLPKFGGVGAGGSIPGTGGPSTVAPEWEGQGPEGEGTLPSKIKFWGGGTPIHTFDPDGTGSFSSFGSNEKPEADLMITAQNALIGGDDYSASRSCLKAAQGTPEGLGFTDQVIDAYRSPTYAAKRKAAQDFLQLPPALQLKFKKKQKNIFQRENDCTDSERTKMCRQLLGRAITDENQANYTPKNKDKILTPEVQKAKEALEKAMKEKEKLKVEDKTLSDSFDSNKKSDKVMELLLIIDQAAANKDGIAAQGAIELLREINPSAAHALDCLGVGKKIDLGFDKEEEFSLDKKPKIGPISGIDYNDDELMEKGQAAQIGRVGWVLGKEVFKGILIDLGVSGAEAGAKAGKDFILRDESSKAELRQEHKDWQSCKAGGSAACDQLYGRAAVAEQRAKEGKNIYTGEPLKKDEDKGTAGPSHPIELDP